MAASPMEQTTIGASLPDPPFVGRVGSEREAADWALTWLPDGGEPVELGAGDLVTFAKGLSCTWDIREPIKKHYSFD